MKNANTDLFLSSINSLAILACKKISQKKLDLNYSFWGLHNFPTFLHKQTKGNKFANIFIRKIKTVTMTKYVKPH